MQINPQITTTDISIHIGLSISGTEKIIRQLKKEGKIKRLGSDKIGNRIVKDNKEKVRSKTHNTLVDNVKNATENKIYYKVDDKIDDKNAEKILKLMAENSKIVIPEIAQLIDLSVACTNKIIKQIKLERKISREGSRKKGQWIVE